MEPAREFERDDNAFWQSRALLFCAGNSCRRCSCGARLAGLPPKHARIGTAEGTVVWLHPSRDLPVLSEPCQRPRCSQIPLVRDFTHKILAKLTFPSKPRRSRVAPTEEERGPCIGSLAEDMAFEELVISNRPCLLSWPLCLGTEKPVCYRFNL